MTVLDTPAPLRLDANEPAAGRFDLAGLAEAAEGTLNRYPVAGASLTSELSARFGVSASQIMLGGGSAELIGLAWRTFALSGAAFGTPSFEFYPVLCRQLGVRAVTWPVFSPSQLLPEGVPGVSLVAVCNPHNPTGLRIDRRAVASFADRLPEGVVVLNDEAYAECVAESPADLGVAELAARPNVLTTRTFSKAYGLPGLRVGYAIGHPSLISRLASGRTPHSVSQLGALGALMALRDDETLALRRSVTAEVRSVLRDALLERGFEVPDSCANFLLATHPDGVDWPAHLAARGVLVKPVGTSMRITVPAPADLPRLLAALDLSLGQD